MIYFVTPAEDFSDGEEVFPKEIAKWNSNDLMDKIEAADAEETPGIQLTPCTFYSGESGGCNNQSLYVFFLGELFKEMTVDYERATSEERLDEVCVIKHP